MERAADVLQDLDDREEVLALLLQRAQTGLEPFHVVRRHGSRTHDASWVEGPADRALKEPACISIRRSPQPENT